MKVFSQILVLVLGFGSMAANAQNRAAEEDFSNSYREEADGSLVYIGSCRLHQDYENKFFVSGKMLVPYFEPNDLNRKELVSALNQVEAGLLIAAAESQVQGSLTIDEALDYFADTDDINIDKVILLQDPTKELYRLNIGVGGGNGYIQIFSRAELNSQVTFKEMTHVFDGELTYCDEEVWGL